MKLDIQLLTTFLRIADAGGFTAAARRYGLSQPTLSRHILQLEEHVGARVFDRDTRNLTLTEVGGELYALSTRLLNDFEQSLGKLDELVAGKRGRIIVSAIPTLAATIVPAAIARFEEAQPDVKVIIIENVTRNILKSLREGDSDIGLTIKPPPEENFRFTSVLRDRFVVAGSPSMDFGSEEIPWAQLRNWPFIASSVGTSIRMMVDAACANAGVELQLRQECAELTTTGGLIRAGLGVTALPELALPLIATEVKSARLIEPEVERNLGILTNARKTPTPAIREFTEILKSEAKQFRLMGRA